MSKKQRSIEYDDQNYFQLASIQSAALGLSVVIIGKQLAVRFGAGTAICSIAIGNLILWLIAISIISMVDHVRASAIDNIKVYLGKYGGVLAALFLIITVLNWYALQINFSLTALNDLFHVGEQFQKEMTIRIGAALGMLAALLSIGGIRLLRKLTVISLPFLFCFHIYAMITSDKPVAFEGTWGVSFTAVSTAVLLLLQGVINFPTFFRHSRSKAHSFLALTLLTIFITFFEVTTIWMDFSATNTVLSAAYIIVILTYCNMVNIYFASACWGTFTERFNEPKGFAIIGLFGTMCYTFIQISTPVRFLQDLSQAYLATLGVVLIMSFLTRLIVKHRPRPLEKSINMATWLFGCTLATIYEAQHFLQGMDSLLIGINGSILFFMVVIFVEETVWATKVKWGLKKG